MRKLFTYFLVFSNFVLFASTTNSTDTIGPINSGNKLIIQTLVDSLISNSDYQKKTELSLKIAKQLINTDWDRCNKYIEIAEDNLIKIDNKDKQITAYIKIADIFYSKDLLDISLKYYQKAYQLINKNTGLDIKNEIENNIAIVYAQLKNTNKALEYFKKVLKYNLNNNDTLGVAKIYNNIGLLYMDTKLDSSIKYYNKSLLIAEKLNNKLLNTYIYTNLARCYSLKNDTIKSYYLFNKALLNINEIDIKTQAWVYKSMAENFMKQNKLDSAISYAKKSEELIVNSKYSFLYIDISKILYKSYLKLKKYKTASKYFEIYDQIRDSLKVEEKLANVTKIKLQQDYLIKDQKRTLQENKRILKYTIIAFSLLFTLLLLSILLIIYKNKLNKSKLQNELIKAKQEEIKHTLESKNRLLIAKAMKELHQTEIIQSILESLKEIKLKAVKKETQQAINIIQKQLESNIDNNIWQEFEFSFEQVNENFYKNLKEKHPDLTSKDKRLCSLLILDLSSKEIAQITGQDFKSVENSRTRLRKKLNLTNTKTDLVTYLSSLKS